MESLDPEGIRRVFLQMREQLEAHPYRMDTVRAFLYGVKMQVYQFLQDDNPESFQIEGNQMAKRIYTMADAVEWLENVCNNVIAYMKQEYQESSHSTIAAVKQYIEQHYTEELTLHAIAGQFYLNPKYLGRLFKSQVHMSFNEYFNRCRIRHIVGKVKRGEPVHRSILNAGYKTPSAFYKAFEKYEGISFVVYKQKLKEQMGKGEPL